jgi:glycosyltransferase involved in cell wall biosynthesis
MRPKDFSNYIAFEHEGRESKHSPEATVVIVTYDSGEDLLALLASLYRQTFSEFEIIVIDNGRTEPYVTERILTEPHLYIRSRRNSLSFGRNIGTAFARGEIIISLDDDCLAHKDLIKAHVQSYCDPSILAVRGKALPKTDSLFNHFQAHYDLGPATRPAVIGLEGNSSYRKRILEEIGGFNPDLFGTEGLELSYRIVQRYNRPEGIIYNPGAIIYHDFAKGFFHYVKKCYRHPKMRDDLVKQYSHILTFAKKYGPYEKPDRSYSSLSEKVAVRSVWLLGRIAELIGKYS